ncbi:hypothetical protein O9993_15955 [Vibrio lentus]|nr:hypothetical protein [Vibrio lentus]
MSPAKGYLSLIIGSTEQQESSNSQENSNSGNSTNQNQQTQPNDDELINQLVVTMPNQVKYLRVKIAEVSRNVSNKLGIKWGSIAGGVG